MENDQIVYTGDQTNDLSVRRPAASVSGGLAGFLIKKGLVANSSQANLVLIVFAVACIVVAIIIPFIW